MREEIRQGNEALAKGDIAEAVRHYRSLLDKGGTEIEERIARNRLSDIAYQEKQLEKGKKKSRSPSRRGGTGKTKSKAKEKKEDKDEGVRESIKLTSNSLDPLLEVKK